VYVIDGRLFSAKSQGKKDEENEETSKEIDLFMGIPKDLAKQTGILTVSQFSVNLGHPHLFRPPRQQPTLILE